MTDTVREQILSAFATQLNAERCPYALEYGGSRVIAIVDGDESISSDYSSDIHALPVTVTAIDLFDESTTNRGIAANTLLGTVYALCFSDITLGGLCENITATQAGTRYSDDPSDYIGVIIECSISYRTTHNDFYTLSVI